MKYSPTSSGGAELSSQAPSWSRPWVITKVSTQGLEPVSPRGVGDAGRWCKMEGAEQQPGQVQPLSYLIPRGEDTWCRMES